ncbi:response regulator transcription factor [Pseudonocardia xishanensis]|uniref:Helix-turn-helix transcriptional regulator n=1 Tax=Pseudonocardia xishanensis TaxID=630995 RepID=A0ABP8RW38_9PSEU
MAADDITTTPPPHTRSCSGEGELVALLDGLRLVCQADLAAGCPLAVHRSDAVRSAVVRAVIGSRTDALQGARIVAGHGVGGQVLISGMPLLVEPYLTASVITHHFDPIVRAEGLTAVLVLPVVVDGAVVGVVGAGWRSRAIRPPGMVHAAMAWAQRFAALPAFALARNLSASTRTIAEGAVAGGDCGSSSRSNRNLLTPRETEVLRHIADGATNGQIAARLYLTEGTVKAYLRSAMRKLSVRNRTGAVMEAQRAGLI